MGNNSVASIFVNILIYGGDINGAFGNDPDISNYVNGFSGNTSIKMIALSDRRGSLNAMEH
jgi:hypothetical protein